MAKEKSKETDAISEEISGDSENEYKPEKPWIPRVADDRLFKKVLNDLLDYN